jgi:VIT1/CCC1 family predicted Fe2+/Mn2+ transporter
MGEEPRGEEAIKRNGFGDLSVVVLDLESATPVKLESEDSNNNNNNNSNGVERSELDVVPPPLMPCDHKHYSHRSPWLRAMVLGANDGLISVASLMLGVGAVNNDVKSMVVSGLAGLVAGACSMAIGEFVSVFSQRDSELADVEKERQVL